MARFDFRLVSFHVISNNERHVITFSYNKKRKRSELRFNKKKDSAIKYVPLSPLFHVHLGPLYYFFTAKFIISSSLLMRIYSKKLSQPGIFPLKLQDDELQWNIKLDYDVQSDVLILHIND